MSQYKDMQYWKKRKAEAARAVKALALKREKTLYLYEVEKQSRRRTRELPLRTLLEYETKELQQAQAGLQAINSKIAMLETEDRKYFGIKVAGVLSLLVILSTFAGMFVYHNESDTQEKIIEEETMISWAKSLGNRISASLQKYGSGDNALTGAVVGIQPGTDNCHEEIRCVNETIAACRNETVQQCDKVTCVNTTMQVCAEECKPECDIEKINGIERKVCVKKCSEACTEEVVEECGSCIEVVEEKCNPEIIQRCNTQIICDQPENSGITGGVTADVVEESPEVGILPIVEGPIEKPIEQPVEGLVEEPVEVPAEEMVEEEVPPENSAEAEPENTEKTTEAPPEPKIIEEEKNSSPEPSLGIQQISIQNIPSITLVLNTTNISRNDTDVNLTAYNTTQTNGNSLRVIYNWWVNSTPIAVANIPFERVNDTTTNNAQDYSGFENNGSRTDSIEWNATGGFDGKGAYKFPGNIVPPPTPLPSMTLGNKSSLKTCLSGCTMNAWIYLDGSLPTPGGFRQIIARSDNTQLGPLRQYEFRLQNPSSQTLDFAIYHNGSSNSASCVANSVFVKILNNSWSYVTGRYNLTHTAVFVNGTQQGMTACSFTNVSPDHWTNSNTSTSIGAAILTSHGGTNTQGFFPGYIDEVTIFNRSLSAEQIFALWQNQTNVIVAQETARNENWTVVATPNNGTGDGTVVISNNVTILNARPVIAPLVLNTTNMSSNNTNVNLTAYANTSDADGDSVKVIYNWLNGYNKSIAVLNMPFEGINRTATNNSWDYSGYGNHGKDNGNAFWNATGGFDSKGAYRFDGVNDFINISDSGYLNFFNNSWTASFWVNQNVVGGFRTFIGKADGTSANNFRLFGTGGNNLNLFYGADAGGAYTASTGTIANAGQWYHLIYGVNAETKTIRYAINGVIENKSAATIFPVNNTMHLRIGTDAAGNYDFNGHIDEVMFFNRSLSDEEIVAIFNNRTDVIVAQETKRGENWSVQATPNDGYSDGMMVTSSNVTIASCDVTLNACKSSDWVEGSTYCLSQSIVDVTGTCMDILNHSITLDCQGFAIEGDISGTDYGVRVDRVTGQFRDVTIKNCVIGNFSSGILFTDVNNSMINNVTFNNNTVTGFETATTINVTVLNSTFMNHTGVNDEGILISSSNIGLNISRSSFTNNYQGIEYVTTATSTINITIENNNFNANSFVGTAVNADNNTLRNNVYMDNARGISIGTNADYNIFTGNQINGSTTVAITFSATLANANQYFYDNLVNGYPYVHCFDNDTYTTDNQFVDTDKITDLGAAIILECSYARINNLTIRSESNSGFGLRIVESNHTIINKSIFYNNTVGIYLDNTGSDVKNLTVLGSTFINNTASGIDADDANNITILNSTFLNHTGPNDEGILVGSSNTNWNISRNNFTNNYEGIDYGLTGNINITIENNNFNASTFTSIVFNGDNATVRDNVFMDNARGVAFGANADYNTFTGNQFNRSTIVAIDYTAIADVNQYFYDNLVNGYPYVHCFDNNSYTTDNQFVDTDKITDLGAAIIFQCSYARINNLTIRSESTSGFGLHVAESNHTIINKSIFYNNTIGIYLDNSGSDVKNLTVLGSTFINNTASGIDADDADNITILNSTFLNHTGIGDQGIMIGTTNANWNISRNNFTNNYEGIEHGLTGNINITIENNNFNASTFTSIVFNGDNATVRDNVFMDNERGVSIAASADYNTFTGNQFNRSTTVAIDFVTIADTNQYFYDNLVNGYPYVHCFDNNSYTTDNQFVDTDKITDLGAAIIFQCSYARINNLTISSERTSTIGLHIAESNHTIVNKSLFYNNTRGIYLDNSGSDVKNLTVMSSNFSNNSQSGIDADDADNITIFSNTFADHTGTGDEGIMIGTTNTNWNISFNNFTNNSQGVEHSATLNVNFTYNRNIFLSNSEGLFLNGDNNTFSENIFGNNTEAVDVETAAVNNLFYRNNFKTSTTRHIEGGVNNEFNSSNTTGQGGNYWDDFDQAGEGCSDGNGDGFCDAPRNSTIHVSFTGQDNHPYVNAINFGAVANTPPPAPVLVSPANLTLTTSRTPTFVWNNSVDADSNPNISYRLEIDNSILFNNPEVNVTGIINTTNDNTTYTITTELAVDTIFFWRVFAYDQTDYSTTANVGNFTVQSLLAVNITNDLVAFGTLANGANVSTTGTPPDANPFRGENVGNIVANITVTGTPFFTAVSMPSTFYRFKIRANESGAFNTTASATEWNETNTTVNEFVFHVVNLDWHSISNDFLTDLNISVPGNESAGSKSSALTFTITG